jgi:hypothetical protein
MYCASTAAQLYRICPQNAVFDHIEAVFEVDKLQKKKQKGTKIEKTSKVHFAFKNFP